MRRLLRKRRVWLVFLPVSLVLGVGAALLYAITLRPRDASFDPVEAISFFAVTSALVLLALLLLLVAGPEEQPKPQRAPAEPEPPRGATGRAWPALTLIAAVIGGAGGAYAYLTSNDTVEPLIVISITVGALAGAFIIVSLYAYFRPH